jgi:MoxR-like ATPase
VTALAEPVLQHRMALGFAARADGMTVRDVIADLKAKIG